jgi:hypothetical protein
MSDNTTPEQLAWLATMLCELIKLYVICMELQEKNDAENKDISRCTNAYLCAQDSLRDQHSALMKRASAGTLTNAMMEDFTASFSQHKHWLVEYANHTEHARSCAKKNE